MRKLSCKSLSTLLLLSLSIPLFASAQVSQIRFTTEPQSVAPGEISGTLTIQLQDSSGNSSPAAETVDVEFTSSSPTGEFLSPSSGNPVTKTISTGSANKNFRYRDSATGIFTLSIQAVGRNTGESWAATQQVTMSSSGASFPDLSGATSTSSSNNQPFSAHYSSSPLSNKKINATIPISAGRDRTGSVGNPLEFKAETELSYTRNSDFRWNFGDGTQAAGDIVTHSYEYPGDYVVVLSVVSPEGSAISRANVRIIEPQLSVLVGDQYRIQIKNSSPAEISLFGWALMQGNTVFVFPKDTLIKSGQAISFSSNTTKLKPTKISEVMLIQLGETEHPQMWSKAEEVKKEKIAQIQGEIESLKAQLASRSYPTPNDSPRSTVVVEEERPLGTRSQLASVEEGVKPVLENGGIFEQIKRFFLRNKK